MSSPTYTNVKPPRTNVKPPYGRLSGDGSGVQYDCVTFYCISDPGLTRKKLADFAI